jgi:hypothetical protein
MEIKYGLLNHKSRKEMKLLRLKLKDKSKKARIKLS